MIIYFAGAIRGDTKYKKNHKEIVDCITSMGHTALSEINDEFKTKVPLTDRQLFKRDLKWIGSSKAVIAEISGASIGVGFEIAYALYSLNKPVLALINSKVDNTSAMINGCDSRLLVVKTYSGTDELEKIISEFINENKE